MRIRISFVLPIVVAVSCTTAFRSSHTGWIASPNGIQIAQPIRVSNSLTVYDTKRRALQSCCYMGSTVSRPNVFSLHEN